MLLTCNWRNFQCQKHSFILKLIILLTNYVVFSDNYTAKNIYQCTKFLRNGSIDALCLTFVSTNFCSFYLVIGQFRNILYSLLIMVGFFYFIFCLCFVFVHVITFRINICWMFWIFCSFFLYSSHSQTDISHTNSVLCFFCYLGKIKQFFLFSFSLLILHECRFPFVKIGFSFWFFFGFEQFLTISPNRTSQCCWRMCTDVMIYCRFGKRTE